MEAHFNDELQLLSNALRTPSFRFILVAHNHRSIYLDIKNLLIEKWGDSRDIKELSLVKKDSNAIRDAIVQLHKGILLIPDLDFFLQEENIAQCIYFNQRRDFFARFDIAFICFIQPSNFQKVAHKLPDWWSLRSLELEFVRETTDKVIEGQFIDEGNNNSFRNLSVQEKEEELKSLLSQIQQTNLDNKPLLNLLYRQIGDIYFAQAEYDKAFEAFEKNLELSLDIGNRKGEGTILNNIGQIYKARGNYDTALRYLEKSLAIQQQIGDRSGEGTTLNNLATIAHVKGNYDTALRYLEKSLAIQQQIGDRSHEGTTLNNISQIYDVKGDYDTALHYLEQSLAIQQEIDDRSGEGTTLNNISQIYAAKGNYDTALRYLEQTLAIQQQIGDRSGEGGTLNNLAGIARSKDDYDTALRYLEQSLAIRQQIGDIAGLATTLHNMGCIFWEQKQDVENAIACFMQAYQIKHKIGVNTSNVESWLNGIKETIGEDAFKAILAAQGGTQNEATIY